MSRILPLILLLAACTEQPAATPLTPRQTEEMQEEAEIWGNRPLTETGQELLDVLAEFNDANPYVRRKFLSIIRRIYRDPSISEDVRTDHLLRYAETHHTEAPSLLGMLTHERTPKLGPWLLQHGDKLQASKWKAVSDVLSRQYIERTTWQDPKVIEAFKKYCLPSKDPDIYYEGLCAVAYAGTLDDVIALIPTLTSWETACGSDGLLRFNHSKTNAAIRKLLADQEERELIESLVGYDFERNNRHDFIPDLVRLRAQLVKVAKVGKKTDRNEAESLIKVIDETLPRLEEIKASGVTPGEHLTQPSP